MLGLAADEGRGYATGDARAAPGRRSLPSALGAWPEDGAIVVSVAPRTVNSSVERHFNVISSTVKSRRYS